ncbi:MAG: hypothetical protein NVS2B11_12540 [Acetobacteraceae bacterium]
MAVNEVNPQPLPPVQLGALTTEVTRAVQAALEQRSAGGTEVFRNPRLIIGLILEPQFGPRQG